MDTVEAELLVWKPGPELGRAVVPPSMGRCPRFWLDRGWVHRLDSVLAPASRRRVRLPAAARLLGATPDLSLVVAGDDDQLYIEGERRFRLPVADADSATWLASGLLLVTAPVVLRSTSGGTELTRRGASRVLLVDGHTGQILDHGILDVSDAGITALPHPSDGSVVLDAGEGQDGSTAFVVRADGGTLTIESLFENIVVASFDRAGASLLLTPHPSFENIARRLTWPTLEEISTLEGDFGALDVVLDVYGFTLGSDRVLLSVVEGLPLLCTPDLKPIARVAMTLPGLDNPEFGTMVSLDDEVFAAELWANRSSSLAIWRVPRT